MSGIRGSALGLVGLVSVYCDWACRKFDLQLLSQCGSTYNCLSRSIPEIHKHVAGMIGKQAINLGTVQAQGHLKWIKLLGLMLPLIMADI